MSHHFIGEAERFLGQDFIALDDHGTIETATLDLAHAEERFDLLINGKGPRSGDLSGINIRIDIDGKVLSMDRFLVRGGTGNFKAVVGQCHQGAVSFADGEGFLQDKEFPVFIQGDCLGLQNHIEVGLGRTVEHRQLVSIHFDQEVIDTQAIEDAH